MKQISVREALRDAIQEEMLADEGVFIIGEEVARYEGAYKVTQGLLAKFGEKRVIDAPITEHGFAGLAVGAAFAGLKPIVEFMTFNFAMQAIDHVINSAAKTLYMSGGTLNCPIVFRGPNGSASRVAAQHSQCYASWYSHCPGLKVVAPFEAKDCKALLKASIRDKNPVVFLEHELVYGMKFDVTPDFEEEMEIGRAVVKRSGNDVTVVGFSWVMSKIYEAANILQKERGISIEVIDLLTLRPIDMQTVLKSVKKTGRLVTVEEGWLFSGIGSEISAQVSEQAFDSLDAPILRVGCEDVPLPYAKNLESKALPDTAKICDAILKVCYLK